ncbi:MAG: 4Fe-4S binding protein [Elusimicrobia bacterium]|nr:4Fe-4S binding protein [Elusimicrobiota bacterium]
MIWPWRRAFQALVLASLFAVPVLARYGHYLWARQVERTLERWPASAASLALRAADATLRVGLPLEEAGVKGRRPRRAMLRRLEGVAGSAAWSIRLFGLSATDLLATLESALASRRVAGVLAWGALIPLAGTLLLGRVFCGWLCPMGLLLPLARRLRGVLRLLELEPLSVSFRGANKYALLAAGAAVALATGLPILHYLYPPAILGREAHAFATVLFDRAEAGRFGFPWGAFSGGLALLALIAAVEVAAAPGFWCATLCPGGALYSALSRWRILRVKRDAAACVDCVLCDKACPMALEPMTDRTGPECDACGACIDACPADALALRVSRSDAPLQRGGGQGRAAAKAAALAAALVFAAPAGAHHIIGLPHYAYDDSFPQAPVLKLRERVGPWEAQLTGYPGNPRPGERSEVRAYLGDPRTREAYGGQVLLEAHRIRAFGFRESILQAREGIRDGGLHRFHVTYPEVGNYELVVLLPGLDGDSTLRFPMVVGEPGSPWRTAAAFGGGLGLFVVVIRALRIKRDRRRARGARA